uniref:Uncharacterized protein n=1 Tax=Caulobacter sp. (strain K31) TaxID=366602 RepID=B0SWQ5_CAUSK
MICKARKGAWGGGDVKDSGRRETPSGPPGHLPQRGGSSSRGMLPLWESCREATEGVFPRHDLSSSRGSPLSVWKGSRSAGRRPECVLCVPFRRSRSLRAVVIRQHPVGSALNA